MLTQHASISGFACGVGVQLQQELHLITAEPLAIWAAHSQLQHAVREVEARLIDLIPMRYNSKKVLGTTHALWSFSPLPMSLYLVLRPGRKQQVGHL